MTNKTHNARLASAKVMQSWTRRFSPTHAAPIMRRTAARRLIGIFLKAAVRRVLDVLGPVEFSVSVNRRGFLGLDALCRVCRVDVHDIGEMCRKQLIADCSICGRELYLDYYLNAIDERLCETTGRAQHRLTHVRGALASEWLAAHVDPPPERRYRMSAL